MPILGGKGVPPFSRMAVPRFEVGPDQQGQGGALLQTVELGGDIER